MCASMFDLKNLKDAFGTAFKERPHGLRKYIILLTIIFVLEILLQNGQHSTTFLFVRKGMWIVIVFAISNFYLIGFLCKSILTYIRTRTTLLVHSVNWFHRFHEIFFHVQMCANFSVSLHWVVTCEIYPVLFASFLSRIRIFTIKIAKTMTFLKELSWSEQEFGQFMGIFGFIGIFTQYVAVPFFVEVVGLHDTTIGILGVIGCAINSVRNANHCYALCGDRWLLFLFSLFSIRLWLPS